MKKTYTLTCFFNQIMSIILLISASHIVVAQNTDNLIIEEQFPSDNFNKMVATSEIFVKFNQNIIESSINNENTLTVSIRENGERVEGSVRLIDSRTIKFTPNTPFKNSIIYSVSLSSSIVANNGSTFAGKDWVFATLYDVGTTTQETVNECGKASHLSHIYFANRERKQAVGSKCSAFGFTEVRPPVALNCKLVDLSLNAIRKKSSTLDKLRGSFDPSFNYKAAAKDLGITAKQLYTSPQFGVNSSSSVTDFYNNNINRETCKMIMQENAQEYGGIIGAVNGFLGNRYIFFEAISTTK